MMAFLNCMKPQRDIKCENSAKMYKTTSYSGSRKLSVAFKPWSEAFENVKFRSEANLRVLPYLTIMMTYDHNFILHWYPSNRDYQSINSCILLLSKRLNFSKSCQKLFIHFVIFVLRQKSVRRFLSKTTMKFCKGFRAFLQFTSISFNKL